MKSPLQTVFSILITLLFYISGSFAQTTPDCDDLIGPPVTDDMFIVVSDCDPRGDIIFTYADFQQASENTDSILGIPTEDLDTNPDLDTTSEENAIDILALGTGGMTIEEMLECFDVLCSPQLDVAQDNAEWLGEAFEKSAGITQAELDAIISDVNQDEDITEVVDQGMLETELGTSVNNLDEVFADAFNNLDIQAAIIEALGLDPEDCNGPSPWDGLVVEDSPFSGLPGGVGESLVKEVEKKVEDILLSLMNDDLGGDPNWFLGEIEGLGNQASGAMMPSPSATSTIQSIQSGVNLYNGNGYLNFPLDNISSKDVAVPIAINSTPGGFKVDDQETYLGTNMDISSGGKITRMVKGLPDEFDGTLESYAYGVKRGVRPVLEFSGVGLGIDTKVQPKFLKRILCRIIQVLIEDLLDLNISSGCDAAAAKELIEELIDLLKNSEDIESIKDIITDKIEGQGEEAIAKKATDRVTIYNKLIPYGSSNPDNESNTQNGNGNNSGNDDPPANNDEPSGPGVEIDIYWTPTNFNYMNIDIAISIPILGKVDLIVMMSFRAGVKVVEVPSPVVIEKRGIGYSHLTNPSIIADLGLDNLDINDFNNLSDHGKLEYLNQAHATRKREDAQFFDPQMFAFMDAFGSLFANIFNTDENNPYPVHEINQLDLEPDEYYYDFGGYSGKFYRQPDNSVTLIPYEDFQISVDEVRGVINKFTFITPEGVKYTFDQKATSRYDTYTLPSSFKYPELGFSRTDFGAPGIAKVEYPNFKFWMGLPGFMEVKKDYLTNYHVEKGPEYTSAWHVSNIHSLISQDSIGFEYLTRDIHYNASKNYSFSFPNFRVEGEGTAKKFITDKNEDLGLDLGEHFKSTEWKNGFSNLTYSMSEVFVNEPVIHRINNNRGKVAVFEYGLANPALPGAELCTRIEIEKNGEFYKAWEFAYTTPDYTETSVECNTPPEDASINGQGAVYADENEYALNFNVLDKDENDKFIFRFPAIIDILDGCLRFVFPIDIKWNIDDNNQDDYYFMNTLSEFGSLMDLKKTLTDYHDNITIRDDQEGVRYQAEFIRNFLYQVYEIGRTDTGEDTSYKIVDIEYQDAENMNTIPKRFSINQDIWGYYNGISDSKSPFIDLPYNSIHGTEERSVDHFAFQHPEANITSGSGRMWQADLNFGGIGQIKKIKLETGAFIEYAYDLHEYPEDDNSFIDQGGLRIKSYTRGSENGPTNKTTYQYHEPTVVNYPVFIDQHPLNRFYKNLEEKITTSWKPLNEWQMNKGAYVGYAQVDELIDENLEDNNDLDPATLSDHGRIEHYFTNPNMPGYKPVTPEINNLRVKYRRILRSLDDDGYNYNVSSSTLGEYHPTMAPIMARPWRLGLELETRVFDKDNQLKQNTATEYQFPQMLGDAGTISYPVSNMYQFLHYGSYHDYLDEGNLYTQVVNAGTRCFNGRFFQIVRFIVDHLITQHPYRYIEKDFPYAEITYESEKIEIKNTSSTSYFIDGNNFQNTSYTYYGGAERKLRKAVTSYETNQPLNTQSTETEYIYADNMLTGTTYNFIDVPTMIEMDGNNYEVPIFQISKLNGIPVSGSVSDFAKYGDRFLPESVWGIRQGEFVLTGKFTSYDVDNGMPLKYQLAKYGTGYDEMAYDLFPEFTMSWTPNLLLDTLIFEGFITDNNYDDLCQLTSKVDPNNLTTFYDYDDRRRLKEIISPGGLQTQTISYNMNPLQTTTRTTFSDSTPEQEQIETSDGWGNFLNLKRQDGAVLSSRAYDNLFRVIEESQLGSGSTKYRYEASPLNRVIETEDAVGNLFQTQYLGPNASHPTLFPYVGTQTTDPNGHVSKNWQDAFGKPVIRISGAEGVTKTTYDEYARVKQIENPIKELYKYTYNKMGLLATKEIPHMTPEKYWYDKSMRMVAKKGANGTLVLDYDNAYRLTKIGLSSNSDYGDVINTVFEEEVVNNDIQDDLLINNYEVNKTWIESTVEAILKNNGVDGNKTSVFTRDDIGRITGTDISYTNGNQIQELITDLNAANIPLEINRTITGPDGTGRNLVYTYGIDDILRQTTTHLDYENQNTLLEKLVYNGADQVVKKQIGGTSTNGFLQTVDYTYDGAGKLLSINQPVETGCLVMEEVCQLYWGNVESNINFEDEKCGNFAGVRLDGVVYQANPTIPLTDTEAIEFFIDEQIGLHGSVGSTEVFYQNYFGVQEDFHISIMQTNIQDAIILFANSNCAYVLTAKECCEIPIIGQGEPFPLSTAPDNPDLFFEQITYDGLDISMIEMLGSCSAGLIRNQYEYDGDHRVTKVTNTLWAPHKIDDAFSSSYSYDPAGNILSLQRNGWVAADEEFRKIDDLVYEYQEGAIPGSTTSLLTKVDDQLGINDPIAQPAGFGKGDAISEYEYDANGNLIEDSGKKNQRNWL